MSMRVLHVCAEVYPLLKTGGLADVTAALPAALAALGCDTRLLVPGFPSIRDGITGTTRIATLGGRFGADAAALYRGRLPDSEVVAYFIDAPALYDRPGGPYGDPRESPYPDNHRRFALLGWVAARLARELDPSWRPHVVHGHDWHAGLAPAYLRADERETGTVAARSVFTIHNLAYQGVFPAHQFHETGLPPAFFDIDGVEFFGQYSFLKAGLYYSDKITTVSPTYAQEIQHTEQGCGLNGLLRQRAGDLHGILNGVDETIWNPAADRHLAVRYDETSLVGKSGCKTALQRATGLDVRRDALLFGVVSRLAEQKGLHLVLKMLPDIVRRGGQFALLGSGDPELEQAFTRAAEAHPGAVAVVIGYDESMSHRLIAGSDVIMVPSRFEPCGLTQLFGLRYGTLPLVRRVGGLFDTVVDCSLENLADGSATGFAFDAFDELALGAAVRRAFALYERKEEWERVQRCAMQARFGWNSSATKLMSVYRQLASTAPRHRTEQVA
ncbi:MULTISPECIES: glycogen synthase GlgA [unclassified Burkholderia]|uniref:glycogen synthase GlgA n=1 Tax=unclassified Burkholderia TaxID=2613784 RepID=UPI002AB31250|nr:MULTISPECIES: glycogen synthase GlgA [unclassified Burkholderia]